jgi:hypothetical protein
MARSPFFRDQPVFFRLARHDIEKALQGRRRQPIFDLWSVVVGRFPPVPNHSIIACDLPDGELTQLSEAHACFRGLKRPVGLDDRGFDMVAYVLKPKRFVVYEPGLACLGQVADVPSNLVFIVYVRLDQPPERRYEKSTGSKSATKGVITHWQFVEADEQATNLPIGYRERYRKRLW